MYRKKEFGELLRKHRRNTLDPDRGGALTQDRLGEFLLRTDNRMFMDASTISRYESGALKPQLDFVLSIIRTYVAIGAINDVEEANQLLFAADFRNLTEDEAKELKLSSADESLLEKSIASEELPALLESNLTDARLEASDLTGASFNNARLENTKFTGVDFGHIDLHAANLINVSQEEVSDDALDDPDLLFVARSKKTGAEFLVSIQQIIDLVKVQQIVDRVETDQPSPRLSLREEQVFNLVTIEDGFMKSNKQIASELVVSETTVRKHLRSIYAKLKLNSNKLALIDYKAKQNES